MNALKKMILLAGILLSANAVHAHEKYHFTPNGHTSCGDWIMMPDGSIQFTSNNKQQAKTGSYIMLVAAAITGLVCSQPGVNTKHALFGSAIASGVANYIISKHVLNDGNTGTQVFATALGVAVGGLAGAAYKG